ASSGFRARCSVDSRATSLTSWTSAAERSMLLQHGLTRERIRQIEKHALLELKKLARDTGFDAAA
ncbi:hypothetical protein AB0C60_14780, partial [Streptomyces sp. NPDC048845]